MKTISRGRLAMFLAGLPALSCSTEPIATTFCVEPGAPVSALSNCDRVERFSEFTEEGEVTSYRIQSDGLAAVAEVSGQQIDVLRFTTDPLPARGLQVGDTFDKVRMRFPHLSLDAGVGELPYVALSDEDKGFHIVFNTDDLPAGWDGSAPLSATELNRLRVAGVNLEDF